MKDFEWLREKLSSLYPCFLIPPLPPAHYNLKDDSPKKMVYLERFINGISEIRTIRSSMLFKDFLTLSQNDFDTKRKEIYDNIPYFRGNVFPCRCIILLFYGFTNYIGLFCKDSDLLSTVTSYRY